MLIHLGVLQRDRALEVFPYDTIRQLHFLNFYFAQHPLYPEVVTRIRESSQKLLDVGCCFGQMMRKLVYDGAPSASLCGLDIEGAFISLGFELFMDRDKLQSTFLTGDIFNMDLTSVQGTIDILQVSAFFHLFTRPKQLLAVRKLMSILRPEPGSIVVGANLGSLKPAEYELAPGGPTSFRHSPESFAELWMEAAGSSGSQWRVDGSLDTVSIVGNEHMPWAEPNIRRIVFTVTRE